MNAARATECYNTFPKLLNDPRLALCPSHRSAMSQFKAKGSPLKRKVSFDERVSTK